MSVETLPQSAILQPARPPEPVLPLTVAQYHEMLDAGILISGDPIELLEGWLVTKMTKHPSHVLSTRKARRAFDRIVPDTWFTDSQDPISTISSEPEPDVVVIRGTIDDFRDRHPGPEDVGLVIEVADSSLERDRVWKKRIYAAARIPCYWIVNLIDQQVESFTSPTGSGESATYASQRVFRTGEQITVELDGSEVGSIAVDALLP